MGSDNNPKAGERPKQKSHKGRGPRKNRKRRTVRRGERMKLRR